MKKLVGTWLAFAAASPLDLGDRGLTFEGIPSPPGSGRMVWRRGGACKQVVEQMIQSWTNNLVSRVVVQARQEGRSAPRPRNLQRSTVKSGWGKDPQAGECLDEEALLHVQGYVVPVTEYRVLRRRANHLAAPRIR
jgi:hypothetical protein